MSGEIETNRLLLRQFRDQDADAYASIRAKPEVMRYLPGGFASSPEETKRRAVANIEAFQQMWSAAPGYGPWAVVERESGVLCGHLGLRRLEDFEGRTELLYMLDSVVWGKGYATEGAVAALVFGFEVLELPEIIGLVLPENTPSARVLAKVGMWREPGSLELFGFQVALYTLSASAWRDR